AAGVSGAVAGGIVAGIALSGAASATGNTITDTIEASIKNGSHVNAAGAVVLHATDEAAIKAASGSAALAVGIGGPAGLAGAIAISLGANMVSDTVTAFIDAATVTGGRVELDASSEADILAVTIGGDLTIGGAATVGGSLAGAGAGSGNTIA